MNSTRITQIVIALVTAYLIRKLMQYVLLSKQLKDSVKVFELQNTLLQSLPVEKKDGTLPKKLTRFLKKHSASIEKEKFRELFTIEKKNLKIGGLDTVAKIFVSSDSTVTAEVFETHGRRYLGSLGVSLPFPGLTGERNVVVSLETTFLDRSMLSTLNVSPIGLMNIEGLYLQASPDWDDFSKMLEIHLNAKELLERHEGKRPFSISSFNDYLFKSECASTLLLRKNQNRLNLLRSDKITEFANDMVSLKEENIQ